jgi:signal transduction histidine kinase
VQTLTTPAPLSRPGPPRLAASAAIAVLAALAPAAASARSGPVGPIGQRVHAIEGTHGNDPALVIEQLRPLEAAAREHGGDDLRVFLAAWGYAHAATDKPAVAEAALEELSDQAERGHDEAALASAWALRACLFQVSGQVRTAYGWAASAVPLAERDGDPDLRYWVNTTAADLAVSTGQIDEGVRLFTAATVDARESSNRRREAQAWLALAPLHLVLGQTAQALEDATRTHELGASSTEPGLAVAGWVMESLAAEQAGDHARQRRAREAAGAASRHLPVAASAARPNPAAGGPNWLSSELDAVLQMASAHLSVRHWPQARTLALRAQALAREQSSVERGAEAAIDLGLAEIGLGRHELGRQIADAAFASIVHRQDADLVLQLHRYESALDRAGETAAAVARLREALLLEAKLTRRDRTSTVVALQRQKSFEQHQRQVERLRHDNAMQRSELERAAVQRVFVFALVAALFLGVVVAAWGYRRARLANRQLAASNAELAFASTQLEESNRKLAAVNEELKELDRMKSDLLANVSHELRTPLTAIKGYTDYILERKLGPITDKQEKGLVVVHRNLDRLSKTINALLDFSSMETGRISLNIQPFHLSQLLEQLLTTLRSEFEKKGRTFRAEIEPHLPPVIADREKISAVIENLVINALKFTPEGGSITVRAARTTQPGKQGAEIRVADTGVGIPTSQLDKIFQRFHQVDGSATRRFGGIGLGLAIVKSILDAHGTNITVDSEEGKGTEFRFILPVVDRAE